MPNFFQLPLQISGINLAPIITQLYHSKLWGESEFDSLRTQSDLTPHNQVSSITFRNNEFPYMDGLSCKWEYFNHDASILKPIIFDVARCVETTRIGRVIVTKLPPFGEIPTHTDQGEYVKAYDRFHVCLQANRNTSFTVNDQTVYMKPGQVWFMDNKSPHSVKNPGPKDRIHLIIDLNRG